MYSIKGAILDIDGTLLDSMHIWNHVAEDYLISMGITPRPDLNEELLGIGGHEIPKYFKVEYGVPGTLDDITRGIYQLLEDYYFHKAELKAGVFDLLDGLSERGIKMVVATATERHLMEPALARCGIAKYFLRIFTCREERTSKSNPDIYIRAADYLGTEIENTLVFEDAPYAVKSAKEAGFPVVGVYDSASEEYVEEIKSLSDYYFYSLPEIDIERILK